MPTEREEEFLTHFLATGDAQAAVRIAFNCSEASVPSRASQLKKHLSPVIAQRLTMEFQPTSVTAFRIIKDLLICPQPSVALKAAVYILEVAGHKAVNKEMKLTQEYNPEELKAELAAVKKQLLSEMPAEELRAALTAQEVH